MTPRREHRFFTTNDHAAECVDCRRSFYLPGNLGPKKWRSTYELGKILRPEDQPSSYTRVGYCLVEMFTYLNPTLHTLNLCSIGYELPIPPGELFQLGSVNAPHRILKLAPQLICVDDHERRTTIGFDLFPFTTIEMVEFTTSEDIKGYRHVGFVNSPA